MFNFCFWSLELPKGKNPWVIFLFVRFGLVFVFLFKELLENDD